jgi:hypothetical protein
MGRSRAPTDPIIAILLLALIPYAAQATTICQGNPLAGLEQNRWQVKDACYQTEGLERLDLLREYPERRADGSVWLVQQWRDGTYTDQWIQG